MAGKLCIHGHFYQPPREDPWLGRILIEPSAAPMRHWNERIVRESYAPLGWARRMNQNGNITDIINCYEWMSFNAGPTLLHWMRREAPQVLARMQEADRRSLERWGHGNAVAQIYHHIIMPLASEQDKKLECAWAIANFKAVFKRPPEGMWLSECAVDLPTLEILASAGIKFVILAPRQAQAVDVGNGFTPVDESSLDATRPYQVELPSGCSITAFFYNGGLSQAIAFEGLLNDGERLWQHLSGSVLRLCGENGLLAISTDGETYGHHFKFGEMALAHALAQGFSWRDGVRLTNFAAYLAENPPTSKVRLREVSSWSCVHGVERWRSNCGCTDGGHPGWNQLWRGPLRDALNFVKLELDKHFFSAGSEVFKNPNAALLEYGEVLADPDYAADFAERHFTALDPDGCPGMEDKAWKLLSMQEHALASFASCAWFFDDISRIEPVNAMSFALKAMELASQTGCRDFTNELEAILEKAESNKKEEGNGKDVFRKRVLPKLQDPVELALMALVWLQAGGKLPLDDKPAMLRWPGIEVEIRLDEPAIMQAADRDGLKRREITGRAAVRHRMETEGLSFLWSWTPPDNYTGVEFSSDDPIEAVKLEINAGTGRLPFVPLLRSSIEAHLPNGEKILRSVADLPGHVRDFLCLRLFGQTLHQHRKHRQNMARHIISVMSPWEEGQATRAYPQIWVEFAPYLVWACCFAGELNPEQVKICAAFISKLNLSPELRRRAADLLEQDFIQGLRSRPVPADKLLRAARIADALLPFNDWWRVQNELWGHPEFRTGLKELAEAFRFKI